MEKINDELIEEAYKAMLSLSTVEWINWFIGHLSNLVWRNIGLIENPVSKKIEKDFTQAQLGIDAINALFNLIKDKLQEEQKLEIQGLISNLQINFINQKNKEE